MGRVAGRQKPVSTERREPHAEPKVPPSPLLKCGAQGWDESGCAVGLCGVEADGGGTHMHYWIEWTFREWKCNVRRRRKCATVF